MYITRIKRRGRIGLRVWWHRNNGQIRKALAQFQRRGISYRMPFYFPAIGEYATILEQQGLQVRYAVLFDRLTELKGEDGLADWIHMFVKKPFEGMNQEMQEEIIDEAVNRLQASLYENGKWYADYVRVRIRAVKL